MVNKLRALFKPDLYHGWGKSRKYFEGWYFRIVDSSCETKYAVIPGVAMDSAGSKHSFIQVLDGKAHSSDYHRFDFQEFRSDDKNFSIAIRENRFSNKGMILDLPGISGNIKFKDSA